MKAERMMLWAYSILVILAIAFGIYYFEYSQHARTPSVTMDLNTDLLPLYANATWSGPRAYSLELPTTVISGIEVHADAATSTMNIAAATVPFETYYQSKLQSTGWALDSSLSASGPGSAQTIYRKGSALIRVSYASNFSNKPANSPEQCPCDVTLSLFSST